MALKLQSKSLKIVAVLNPAAVQGIAVPNGVAKISAVLEAGGVVYRVELPAKGLRRAVASVNEAGTGGVSLIVQGRITAYKTISEAGIIATPRTVRTAPADALTDA